MQIHRFQNLPKVELAYAKIVKGLVFKKKLSEKVLPKVKYIAENLAIDVDHLQKYKAICHFDKTNQVPAIYLSMLAQTLQMHMMANEDFPFAVLGLVHIRNKITQFRPIRADEVLNLHCSFGEVRAHEKGLEFDFITSADINGEQVYSGSCTYLSRQKSTVETEKKPKSSTAETGLQSIEDWDLSDNLGRRYARISGDFNLIHLHPLTAKAFGFKKAIAHGMWNNARALAALSPLPDAYVTKVEFKLPVFLPAKIEILANEQQTQFLVQDKASNKPHLVGSVQPV